jgi:phosphoserine phosphatase RsbU/P
MNQIDNNNEIRDLRRAVAELSLINDIISAISSVMSTDEISKLIVNKCLKHFGAEQGYISLFDFGQEDGEAKTFIRVHDQPGALPMRIEVTLSAWMSKYNQSLLVNEAQNDPRFKEEAIRSVVAAPLKIKDTPIGFLTLFNKKDGLFTENDLRLLSTIALQSSQVIEAARLYEEEKKLNKIQQELKAAQEIQRNLMPRKAPEVPGFVLSASYSAAKEVGGDYVDFFNMDSGKLGIVLGDVSGKGLPAALLMSNLHATLHSLVSLNQPLDKTITQMNQTFFERIEPGKFVTLFFGILDSARKTIEYCNAGHNPPMLFRKNNAIERLTSGGMVLGIMPSAKYACASVQLQPGDRLVIFSDGVTEAVDSGNEQYGEKRLKNLILRLPEAAPRDAIDEIVKEVTTFRKGIEQNDDLSLIIVKCAE